MMSLDEESDLLKLALELRNASPIELDYKNERGFMLVEGLNVGADVNR